MPQFDTGRGLGANRRRVRARPALVVAPLRRCESCRGMEWEIDQELYALPGFRCEQVLPMVLVVCKTCRNSRQPPLSCPGGRASVAGRRRRTRDRSLGAAAATRRATAAHRHLEADRRVPAPRLTADRSDLQCARQPVAGIDSGLGFAPSAPARLNAARRGSPGSTRLP